MKRNPKFAKLFSIYLIAMCAMFGAANADQIYNPSEGGGDMLLEWVTAPATATSSGTAGQIAYDSNYFYVCVSTDVWRRTVMASW